MRFTYWPEHRRLICDGCDGGSADHEASATALYKLNDLLPKLYTQAEAA